MLYQPRTLWLRALFALALGLCWGCGGDSAERPPNVVLIVVDTLRQDRLGVYGAERDTSPEIDALARESLRFEHAYSTAPWTAASMASIFTGRYPSGHGLTTHSTGLPDEAVTLAERLKAEGYQTAAVVSNPHLKQKWAFDQGFDHYLDDSARGHDAVTTPEVTTQAIELLDTLSASAKPFFLFLLYFDPHYEYRPHPEFGFAKTSGRLEGRESIHQLRAVSSQLTPHEIQYLRDIYDEEVRFTDRGIGRLLSALRERKLYEQTVIALTADHGEELLDRGWLGHVRSLYDELVRAPLLLHAPGLAPGVIETPVSLASLAPTLLELTGADPGQLDRPGPSLAPLFAESPTESWPPVFLEVDFTPASELWSGQEAHKRALVQGRMKLIQDTVTGRLELYDLDADPFERRDLSDERPELSRSLLSLLEREQIRAEHGALPTRELELSEEERETLRALGYGVP